MLEVVKYELLVLLVVVTFMLQVVLPELVFVIYLCIIGGAALIRLVAKLFVMGMILQQKEIK